MPGSRRDRWPATLPPASVSSATLRPFVHRRYLDFGAFEGLREMKTLIEAEVQRRDLEGHLKLGRGGIREIEFIVQLQQLIRGGREPALRERGLLPALAAPARTATFRTPAPRRWMRLSLPAASGKPPADAARGADPQPARK